MISDPYPGMIVTANADIYPLHNRHPDFFPAPYTTGKIKEIVYGLIRVQWEQHTTHGDGCWFCLPEHLDELTTDAKFEINMQDLFHAVFE